ncbi:hypothetical protein O181_112404 [Austropuccinia psidii MF-1]|uniref:Uncharacterized protein n=1 Tax=Austropuccinia psidii MF-1 TaxID=1389203 RepID=A0A9Q3PSQ4_9BASI|nr:hypothetical protein [Austropuccinia psidii MF-1]
MDLAPSSYHESLEELWDGEVEAEEVETMIKVVASAYRKYLDVSFKVKAEKLPVHLTCDYHIKLDVRFYYETDDNITINQHYYVFSYEI